MPWSDLFKGRGEAAMQEEIDRLKTELERVAAERDRLLHEVMYLGGQLRHAEMYARTRIVGNTAAPISVRQPQELDLNTMLREQQRKLVEERMRKERTDRLLKELTLEYHARHTEEDTT